ncbi:type II toxin-antitoxin system CcdA family antitoxin [Sphingomonas sp. KR1UV-12]|uniref:Type II toxin-antitoxin system CcdA family antitoxin n=1 Tax=Sphingomonas aurea TaxID=3063994 RepID=A0ABT9ENY9_9SPHN|nr:type II toxin-antitoxin system CcdA family antitoxin [Sphingomonas sp. KR1UV-12]MDP1028680.1 type II toxin-antitoxin system CcdA family antitoxin [Sphingomonas sp. KR1UV-12]
MKHDPIMSGKRKPVNLSIDTGIVAAAREAGINLSQACEAALRDSAKAERDRKWREDNRDWADAVNRWVEENGLPLEKYRLF